MYSSQNQETDKQSSFQGSMSAPTISSPSGGGAIRGIGEKFAASPVTGTGSFTVPIATSPGRSGFGPELALSYNSGSGNGIFGFGWSMSLPQITRKTDRGLPEYNDAEESDVFVLSGAEDLVPVDGSRREDTRTAPGYVIHRYRPRIEGLFARIERWTHLERGDVHWRSISKDNVLTIYGKDSNSRVANPQDVEDLQNPVRIFSWLISEVRDDKGNVVLYEYKPEDGTGVDVTLAHERNRGPKDDLRRSANTYLKRIKYGNQIPLLNDQGHRPVFLDESDSDNADWTFEVVFDYGDHDSVSPNPKDDEARDGTGAFRFPWTFRQDPFSTYRATFEVRTSRLCQRVLMFHNVGPNGTDETNLVRSTDFTYSHEQDPSNARNPVYTFLQSVTQTGYKDNDGVFTKRSLPPLEFEYTQPVVQDSVEEIDSASLQNLPMGVEGAVYQWVDLHGEGIPGILTEQANAWFYKRNLSPIGKIPVEFGALEGVATKPNLGLVGGVQFMDLAGDGQQDLVMLDGPLSGLYEHDGEEGWQPFRAFISRLNRNMRDPNLKFVDLNGDGHADVLITEDDAFVWHPSLTEKGFDRARRVSQALDEEDGPRLVFADGTQSVYLTDISGDGLTDLARIRNGEICYWPNLGYGRFGAKVTMDDAPRFDSPEQFDHKRIRLADIDGSGTTDIIYLHRDGVRLYFNQSGNGWSGSLELAVSPRVNDLVNITVTDLLGNGTACLVWSSPLPNDEHQPMRYVNLIGEHKPHLLVRTVNNLGAETRVQYSPSTKFYLQDKRDGKPWITKLSFPVHVVERVETIDHISRTVFSSRYGYHHGCFDGAEREFRGFGMVEQWDTESYALLTDSADNLDWNPENVDAGSHMPPAHTRTWFHTGASVAAGRISLQFKADYYRAPDMAPEEADDLLLPDTVLPPELSPEEAREAVRALKGSMLRQEVYADDGSEKSSVPYTVTEQNFSVRRLQLKGDNRHGVFFVHPRETLSFHYERNLRDPRVSHQFTLKVDDYGNVEKALAVGYGRRSGPESDPATSANLSPQHAMHVTLSENTFTNAIDNPDEYPNDYRAPLAAETRAYELGDFGSLFSDMRIRENTRRGLKPVRFKQVESLDLRQLTDARLLLHERIYYRADDLTRCLDLGELELRALPCEGYKLALTADHRATVFANRLATSELPIGAVAPVPRIDGGYVALDGDGNWWISSGRAYFSPNANDAPADELAHAHLHFFLPHRHIDPFGAETSIRFDEFDLVPLQTRDAHGNTTTAGEVIADGSIQSSVDYRVLQPTLVTDPNGNRTAIAFDALGLVVGAALTGKRGALRGDSLDGFIADITDDERTNVLGDPLGPGARELLANASQRFVYDVWRYARNPSNREPVVALGLSREIHSHESAAPAVTPIQYSLSYSDGFGREIQKKALAESGPLRDGGSVVDPRWIVSGWTIFNNKGKPVRQYEPFFDDRHTFRFGSRVGVSPTLFYDPVGRVVATLHPNHTYEKVVFDAWRQESWDVSDTVLEEDPAEDEDVGEYFRGLPWWEYMPTWYGVRTDPTASQEKWPDRNPGTGDLIPDNAHRRESARTSAEKSAAHANTQTISHFESLGRPFSVVAHLGPDKNLETRTELDIEGHPLAIIDPRGNTVMDYRYGTGTTSTPAYDLAGRALYQKSMDAGERWMLPDAAGQPMLTWDSRGNISRTVFDALRRPTEQLLKGPDGQTRTIERTRYGDRANMTEAERNTARAANQIGQVIEHKDQSGVKQNLAFDFKGNLVAARRQLALFEGQQESLLSETPAVDWSSDVTLEDDIFETETAYDALNRPIYQRSPDGSIGRPGYNEAGLLERVDVHLKTDIANTRLPEAPSESDMDGRLAAATTSGPPTAFVTNIDYDAKGQRTKIQYGNRNTTTTYTYDKETYRLTRLLTWRDRPDERPLEPDGEPQKSIQDLKYTYDPIGNITEIRDTAQDTIFFRNTLVTATTDYTYDALYRLTEARGREHLGLNAQGQLQSPNAPTHKDAPRTGHVLPGDHQAMGLYEETYAYDDAGNINEMAHHTDHGIGAPATGWTRTLDYEETNNRLTSTEARHSNGDATQFAYPHNAHGSITQMTHLPLMRWNYAEQLVATSKQVRNGGVPETTYYVYGSESQRARKITYHAAPAGSTPRRKSERIYLGGFEIYREYDSAGVQLERETLHVMDGEYRIALVETKTRERGNEIARPEPRQRYQLGNHLGSASLELAENADVISYEEYFPYGATSYQVGRTATEVSAKRYRYTGMERDEETGLSYHTARYYAPWLGRWVSADPIGIEGGMNLYGYAQNHPIILNDRRGTDATVIEERTREGGRNIINRTVHVGFLVVRGRMGEADDQSNGVQENELRESIDVAKSILGEKFQSFEFADESGDIYRYSFEFEFTESSLIVAKNGNSGNRTVSYEQALSISERSGMENLLVINQNSRSIGSLAHADTALSDFRVNEISAGRMSRRQLSDPSGRSAPILDDAGNVLNLGRDIPNRPVWTSLRESLAHEVGHALALDHSSGFGTNLMSVQYMRFGSGFSGSEARSDRALSDRERQYLHLAIERRTPGLSRMTRREFEERTQRLRSLRESFDLGLSIMLDMRDAAIRRQSPGQ